MRTTLLIALFAAFLASAQAADNLKLNPKLDYDSDSHDGPLITGEHMEDGIAAGKPSYVIFFGEECYNSKRQARRTVSLYNKYKGRVQFVVVDLDVKRAEAHKELVRQHYRGYIPHITIFDKAGKVVYDRSGEFGEEEISALLDRALK
ncbi:MAG: TlpA family protein disulfide reductase [Terriglobales bacterium]